MALILALRFMKEGRIIENGRHRDLMKLDGEYAKFYNLQANAFTDMDTEKNDLYSS